MDGLPILDYTPQTLLGVVILAIVFGWLVPYRTVKQKDAEITILRSTNATLAEALAQHNETAKVVQRIFGGLEDGAR